MNTRPPASQSLVTTEWLVAHLDAPDIVVVDGSYYLPSQNRDAHAEYLAAHIPGAVFFDINAIADTYDRIAAYAAGTGSVLVGDAQARHRRRRDHRRL